MALVVRARDLTKIYRLPEGGTDRYRTIRTDLSAALKRGLLRRPAMRLLRAVSGVSFDVAEGDALGLIGRNGAGKSTLMRMLARVTRPTSGGADVYGKVGALLEVGTGFHPELTGRDNIYLSGAILGMPKRDVAARFDEIVSFAELEQFVDTPVKRYSSGMYARLGFSVAAHLRPALLMVDEALAVGDIAFQAKCILRMNALIREGTAVMFVSHNLLAVADFCPRTLVLVQGELGFDGPTREALEFYRRSMREANRTEASQGLRVEVDGTLMTGLARNGSVGGLTATVTADMVETWSEMDAVLNLVLETHDGHVVAHLRSDFQSATLRLRPGPNTYSVDVPELPLMPGDYWLWLRLVGMGDDTATMWDSERVLLSVPGERHAEAVLQPAHRFEQRELMAVRAESSHG